MVKKELLKSFQSQNGLILVQKNNETIVDKKDFNPKMV